MIEKPSAVYLRCNQFYNPTGYKCKGKLDDVGPEGGGRYNTRLRCTKCSRTITIAKTDVERMLERAKSHGSDDDDD